MYAHTQISKWRAVSRVNEANEIKTEREKESARGREREESK